MMTFGTSLNLAAKGGESYGFTTISSGIGGSSACSVLSITGILNCKGSSLSIFICLPLRSSNGLYSSF